MYLNGLHIFHSCKQQSACVASENDLWWRGVGERAGFGVKVRSEVSGALHGKEGRWSRPH